MEHLQRIAGDVGSRKGEGAELVTGGERVGSDLERGFFYRPTVLTEVRDHMRIAREEIFGPVLSLMPYDGLDEAVLRANATDHGLVAAIWTKDLATAHTLPPRIAAGTVFVNQLPLIDPGAPWCGFGLSGWGRELDSYSIDGFTESQSVFINLS
ncbi:aldehyde dehydrogenase family protein [Streptomyces sp. NPDC057236]|uniref:aldehyde dehydrogenase family protein n=1 Tax=Streptomyces sp. NPDC057236 TaxID=3346059 RepID=UPI0036404621